MASLKLTLSWFRWVIAGLCITVVVSGAPRTWTAVDGREMEATFVRLDVSGSDPEVVFRMPTGVHGRVALSMLSKADQQFVEKASRAPASGARMASVAVPPELTDFEKLLADVIRHNDRGSLRRQPASEFAPREYYALYFSAEWCPPCRNFTPALVEFYTEQKEAGADFEVLLVSSDRDERSMRDYVSNYNMTFPVVDYRRIGDVRDRVERWGGGIPNLVVLDREGKVLFQSYEQGSGRFLGPRSVLERLRPLLIAAR